MYTFIKNQLITCLLIIIAITPQISLFAQDTIAVNSHIGCSDTSSMSIDFDILYMDVACHGEAMGSISTQIHRGQAPFQYHWSDGSTSSQIDSIPEGQYVVSITDANGCIGSSTISISEPSSPLITYVYDTEESCHDRHDGSAFVTAQGGVPPYRYLWSNGATNATIGSLAPGHYSVTVSDDNGCTSTGAIEIDAGPSVDVTVTAVHHVSCNGGSNGSATISVSGQGPFSYAWNHGGNTPQVNNLTPGQYNVTVTDNQGCIGTNALVVFEPTPVSIAIQHTDEICIGSNNGTASISVSGGIPNYTYRWSNNERTPSITQLQPGAYSIQVTDANGCVATNAVNIGTGYSFNNSIIKDDPSCNGSNDGQATITPLGGVAPYHYAWSTGSSSNTTAGLVAGQYTVIVTDINGCEGMDTVDLVDPLAMTVSASSSNVRCHGQSNGGAQVSIFNGTAPYSISWSNAASGQAITGLPAGGYSVVVTDANGCNHSDYVVVNQPPALALSMQITHETNLGEADGAIDLTVSGGRPGYQYSWTNGKDTEDISGLVSGLYDVVVTDGYGCRAALSGQVNSSNIERNNTNSPLANILDIQTSVWPNPFQHELTIQINGVANITTFELYDIKGKRIIKKEITNGMEVITLDPNLPAGMYIARIATEGYRRDIKLIKE